MKTSRKTFIKAGALTMSGMLLGVDKLSAITAIHQTNDDNLHKLQPLGYGYNSLEPWIDAQTMEIHYTKHHQAYVNKLNDALQSYSELRKLSLAELLGRLTNVPEGIRGAVRNNGGGHWNHTFFWSILKTGTQPGTETLKRITNDFGSIDAFKEKFEKAATSQFGSGWAWLIEKNGKLQVIATANQDNPIMNTAEIMGKPILAIDVWEHAYYLKYQNKRADYVKAFWNVVNWERVESILTSK